ncbi:PREDICTED: flowering time control protein FCA-like isoform X3 [Tarenaya hassleriana]|uniref:flowering time control protein FCA-like isoform X3 n=1 Tax=Tarenaya hassleriana TaxID=28532 RepID=UPI00053C900F|nr:PREDICTED: flowering time control protein FCA-like isoform X3 [Tarenaya hassleriana]
MNRYDDDDDGISRRRRRGNSPSSYRVGIDGVAVSGSRRRAFESPPRHDVPGAGRGGFRPMNVPPGGVDFQRMGPGVIGGFRQMSPAGNGGGRGGDFRPMDPSGGVGGDVRSRPMVGSDGGGGSGRGGFRPAGSGGFSATRDPGGGGYGGVEMGFQSTNSGSRGFESEYPLRPTPPPVVQQPLSGQKRGFPFTEHGSSPGTDLSDHGSFIKLFVGSVPRTAREEDIRPFFERHGNVLEVALIKDKRTGQQQGCCFVKYATVEDADRAIRALHNQITLPGGVGPIQVRYADGERERLGALEFKLFVGSLNKQASEKEVEEIFSQFGRVEDVYLMRDEYRQSRGCGFVKYSNKETAMAAIHGLNGVYTMRGCTQPLTVRFADPKRPRPGESRDTVPAGGPGSGPRFQNPISRPLSNSGEPIGDGVQTNPWRPMSSPNIGPPPNYGVRGLGIDFISRPGGQGTLPSNVGGPSGGYGVPPLNPLPIPTASSSATMQQKSVQSPQDIPRSLQLQSRVPGAQVSLTQTAAPQNPYGYGSHLPSSHPLPQQSISPATAPQAPLNVNLRPTFVSSATDQLPAHDQQQQLQQMQQPPSQLAQLLSQQTQTLQATFQSSQQAFSQLQQQLQSMQQPNQSSSVPQNNQAGKQQWPGIGIQTVGSTAGFTPVGDVPSAASTISQSVATVRCNWTEHTSPDGFKYYFNGVTHESRWEKPEEVVQFEQQHQQQKQPVQQIQTQLHRQILHSQQVTQQPQQVHQLQTQYHDHQQSQQSLYSSSYPTPGVGQHAQNQSSGVGQTAQYPVSRVSQNAQYLVSGVGQNAQEYGRTQIPVGDASVKNPAHIQQGYQSTQEFMWKNKASGT